MTGPLEKTITRNIKKYLEGLGFYVIKLHGSPYQRAGLPDLLAYGNRPIVVLALEVKRPGNIPTELQRKTLDEMRNHGAYAHVVTSIEDVQSILRCTPMW